MELDEIRQRWQQSESPPLATPGPNDTALRVLLTRPAAPGLIEKMRRNARWEAALTAAIAVGLPVLIVDTGSSLMRFYAVVMLFLAIGLLFYYYQKLNQLRRMSHADAHVRQHLANLCAGLRQLLQFYYRLTLACGPLGLLMGLGFFVGREAARPGYFRWQLIGIVAAVSLVFGLLLQVAVIYGTRWWLQKLYGQHLDQLEQSLAELDEPATNFSD